MYYKEHLQQRAVHSHSSNNRQFRRADHCDPYLYAVDIAHASRNFHSDPLDWPLMGIAFVRELLIETALLFGSRKSSFHMQKIAEFIELSLAQKGICILIYLKIKWVWQTPKSRLRSTLTQCPSLWETSAFPWHWISSPHPPRFLTPTIPSKHPQPYGS